MDKNKNMESNFLFTKRFIFDRPPEAPKSATQSEKAPEQKSESVFETMEKLKIEEIKVPFKKNDTPHEIAKRMSEKTEGKIDSAKMEAEYNRTLDSYMRSKYGAKPGQESGYAKKFLNALAEKGADQVKYGKYDSLTTGFSYYKGNTEIQLSEIDPQNICGTPINNPKHSPSPGKGAELAANRTREIDAEAEAKIKEQEAKTAQGKAKRAEVFGNEEDTGGEVKWGKGKEGEEKYKETKISDIYPDAMEGDSVEIADKRWTTPRIAIFQNGEWKFKDAEYQGKTVTVGRNAKLTWNENPKAREKTRPKPPENLTNAGYFRVKESMTWKEIARTILKTTNIPKGENIKEASTGGNPAKGSPSAKLQALHYDPTNEQDIARYAQYLQQLNKDPLHVFAIIPDRDNPRYTTEQQKTQREQSKKTARKRGSKRALDESMKDTQIEQTHFRKLVSNEEYRIKPRIVDVINNDKLWDHYWQKGLFQGTELIKRGFQQLGVPETKIRDVLRDAIQQGSNKYIDFEDLIDAFDNKGLTFFKTVEGKNGDFDDLKNELTFFQIAHKIESNKPVSKENREWYKDNKEDFLKPGMDASNEYFSRLRLVNSTALIMEGLNKMDVAKTANLVEREMEQDEATKERVKDYEEESGEVYRKAPTKPGKAEAFLQNLFHPQNVKGYIETVEGTEEEIGSTGFENRYCESSAYRYLKLQAAPGGKLDAALLATEMNDLVKTALMKLAFLADAVINKNNPKLKPQLDALIDRYFYKINPEYLKNPTQLMQLGMSMYKIPTNLSYSPALENKLRNIVQDGFAIKMDTQQGNTDVDLQKFMNTHDQKEQNKEAAKQSGEWKSTTEIINMGRNEMTKSVLRNLISNPKYRELSKEEQANIAKKVDEYVNGKQTFEDDRLFNVNAGIDTSTGKWNIGLSKEIFTIPGLDIAIQAGVAVNPMNGEVMVGIVAGKQFELSEQWSANVAAAGGVVVNQPRLSLGAEGGFTWMSKGSTESPWREHIKPGVGVGTSASFNLTDIYIGPHISLEVGQTKDNAEYNKQLNSQAYISNRIDLVDKESGVDAKANAIRNLPRGTGDFMCELQYNMKLSDAQLVQFYEEHAKKGLEGLAFDTTMEAAGGLSEWGIGGKVDPFKLALLGAVFAGFGAPAAMTLTVALFGKLGITVGKTIKVERTAVGNVTEAQREVEQKMLQKLNQLYPGVRFEIAGENFQNMEAVKSAEFAGRNMSHALGLPEGRKDPNITDFREFSPSQSAEFKELQGDFLRNGLKLTLDPETKMYQITPVNTEHYRIYADPDMAKENAIILRGNRILVATSENLSNLFIKRFDTMYYPGEVDGAVQHTVITISDNPDAKMGEITMGDTYINGEYNRDNDNTGSPRMKGSHKTIMTYDQYKAEVARGRKFNNSETRTAEYVRGQENSETRRNHLRLTADALDTIPQLEKPINLEGVKIQPKEWIKKNPILYRKLSTNPTEETLNQLDSKIKSDNPNISDAQLILYKEKLFQMSMSENKAATPEETLNRRLRWARNAVFIPFFRDKINTGNYPEATEKNITAEELADKFLAAIRATIEPGEQGVEIPPGFGIFTSVGTYKINGTRRVEAASGENNENNKFIRGFDYSEFLDAQGSSATPEQKLIAKMLVETHSAIPKENTAFLNCRLAKKLFYLGVKGEVPNPMINILGQDKFELLKNAYIRLASGETTLSPEFNESIQSFREICEQLRTAQLGEGGTPVLIDGSPARAIAIGDYYITIKTTIESGVYEYCRNPSVLYNEEIQVFKKSTVEQAKSGGAIVSGAGGMIALESRQAQIQSVGLNAIATRTFKWERKEPPEEPIGKKGEGHPPEDEPPEDEDQTENPESGGEVTEGARNEEQGPESKGGTAQPAPGRGEHPSKTQTSNKTPTRAQLSQGASRSQRFTVTPKTLPQQSTPTESPSTDQSGSSNEPSGSGDTSGRNQGGMGG